MSFRRFRSFARTWEGLGRTNPLFGILSDPAKHGAKWDADEFFGSGRAHVASLLRSLDDLRVSFNRGTCLDFGCGVGRLTAPLSRSFTRTVGVDIARSMIDLARQYHAAESQCEFVVNPHLDLRQFPNQTFDVVHSCLVLQHIAPEISLRYIAEFFRVCKAGGLVVFQIPSETLSDDVISAAQALPDSAYAAAIAIPSAPASLEASQFTTLDVVVTNSSPVAWRHDIPAGRHICLANHWLRPDGTMAIQDDGRARLPKTIGPGERAQIPIEVQAPAESGDYLVEMDLVQELVCWFAEKGSRTGRSAITVREAAAPQADSPAAAARSTGNDPGSPRPGGNNRKGLFAIDWIRRRLRLGSGTDPFEMHTVPRPQVEEAVRVAGGQLLRAIDDNAAGPRWCSYTYVCRRVA